MHADDAGGGGDRSRDGSTLRGHETASDTTPGSMKFRWQRTEPPSAWRAGVWGPKVTGRMIVSAANRSRSSALLALFLLGALPTLVRAESDKLGYRDGDGRWQWMTPAEGETFALKGGVGTDEIGHTFLITFRDVTEGTGVGFDDPESGEARRATMHAVLRYLSSVLDVPGRAELVVMPSQTDGEGALASAGPFLLPGTGFQGGLVFEHLTSGQDPRSDAMDGTVTVDFGYDWNASEDPPTEEQHDLYTVLLHELTHALGFVSIVGPDGRSALFNDDGRGLLSIYDSLLLRGETRTPLFLEDAELNASEDDVSSNDIFLAAPRAGEALGGFPRVYAPRVFSGGSSLGHWSFAVGPDAVMVPALSRGVQKKEYTAWELQGLADLGYDLVEDLVPEVDGGVASDPGERLPPFSGTPPTDAPASPEREVAPPPAAASGGCTIGPAGTEPSWLVIASCLVFLACAARAAARRSGSAG